MADEQEDIQMTFAKMMFGDALNDDELRMISGVEGVMNLPFDENANGQQVHANGNGNNHVQSNRVQSQSDESMESSEKDKSFVIEEEEEKASETREGNVNELGIHSSEDRFSVDEDEGEAENQDSQYLFDRKESNDNFNETISSIKRVPSEQDSHYDEESKKVPKKLRFDDDGNKGIDLPILLKTRNEIIYRLTQLYIPKNENQKRKMIDFNKEKMHHFNHDENDIMRKNKRKIKEEIKSNTLKQKLKHQIQYVNPAPLLEDAIYLYTPGVTSKQLDQMKERGRHPNAPHIGRILPSKRLASQALIDQQKGQSMLQLQELNKTTSHNQESQVKSYLLEDKCGIGSESLVNEWDKQIRQIIEPKDPATFQFQKEEKLYQEVIRKMKASDLSLADLPEEERIIVKVYLDKTAKQMVTSKYPPALSLNPKQKSCFSFMTKLNPKDFSYQNQKSAFQSDDQVFLYEDNNMGLGMDRHTAISDDRLSFHSDTLSFNGNNSMSQGSRQFGANSKKETFELSEFQLQEQLIEQKYKMMSQVMPVKRRQYWGEPLDCKSASQINLDNYQFQKFQNRMYIQRGCQDEKLFKIEKAAESSRSMRNKMLTQGQDQVQQQTLKDLTDYKFLTDQEKYFYEDTERKSNVNSIMRKVQFQLGLITKEEFYQQEQLADQVEGSSAYSKLTGGTGKDKAQEKQLELQMRKEKICHDLDDNYDHHYEKRKKELHDVLMKKIQQHEKQNQQPSSTQQTVAYASGSHALLSMQNQLDGSKNQEGKGDKLKSLVNYNKMGQDNKDQWRPDHLHLGTDEDASMIDDNNQRHGEGGGAGAEDNQLNRVTKNKANELNHAKCILKLTFTKFDWREKDLLNFHRSNIDEAFQIMKYEEELYLDEKRRIKNQALFPRSSTQIIINAQGARVNEMDNMMIQDLPQQIYYVQVPVSVVSNDLVEKRFKKIGIINAHEYFKDRFKLSLRDGKFCLFEHIDQNPLFINNFGMASKLKRYIYSDHPLPPSAFLKRAENASTRHMGCHGAQVLKQKGDKIPLLGQLDTRQFKGITVMENNLYYCPVFYHKANRNDFLCVMHRDKKGKNQILVRDIQDLYVMGQEEPKHEVYNPQSRQYQHFIKRRTQAYVIRFLQENRNEISFVELNKFFPYINDQILKKIIKEINVEVDRNQLCSLTQEYTDESFKQLITPENICQYESAQFGEQILKKVGIKDITNADKISYATNKFCSEETNIKKQQIARLIEEEVLSTPWNLSQNFIHNKQTRGMMMLEGIGDPSNGNGGYSYLKLPLKISQDSLNKAKINRMYLNPAIQNPKAVTGTDADLRKLSKGEIRRKLIEFGFKEKDIQSFTRWEMVAVLREQSCLAVQQGEGGDMKKFARGVRFTSKKQREMYQKQVNEIFKKQIGYLSKENGDFISDVSGDETGKNESRIIKRMTEQQQMNNNYTRNIVEMTQEKPITRIQDIPNYEVLIMASQPLSALQLGVNPNQANGLNIGGNSGAANSGIDLATGNIDPIAAKEAVLKKLSDGGSLKCVILRKKIKKTISEESKEGEEVERIIFCSDPRQIKGFNKRKHKHEVKTKRNKKTSLKEKMQLQKANFDDFKDRNPRSETSSLFRQSRYGAPASGTDTKIKIGNTGGFDSQSQSEIYQDYSQQHLPQQPIHQYHHQSSSIAIPIGKFEPSERSRSRPAVQQKKSLSRFQSINLSSRPFDQISMSSPIQQNLSFHDEMMDMGSNTGIQIPQAKITLNLGMGGNQNDDDSYNYTNQKQSNKVSLSKDSKKIKKVKTQSKFAQNAYTEEDYETYKPKTQTTSRRVQSVETILNEIFGNVIDACQKFDTGKIFHYKVTRKEAPSYHDVIKNPIDLKTMRDKTKRSEYLSSEQFLNDLDLLQKNAIQFNTEFSPISALAKSLYQFGKNKLMERKDDVDSVELLVREQQERKGAKI